MPKHDFLITVETDDSNPFTITAINVQLQPKEQRISQSISEPKDKITMTLPQAAVVEPNSNTAKPTAVHFPDGTQAPINTWKGIIIAVAKYLHENVGLNPATGTPLQTTERPNRNTEIAPGLHICHDYIASLMLRRTNQLIHNHGENPESFRLTLQVRDEDSEIQYTPIPESEQ